MIRPRARDAKVYQYSPMAIDDVVQFLDQISWLLVIRAIVVDYRESRAMKDDGP